jgi:WD40 repeat protein
VRLRVLRAAKERTIIVTLIERPAEQTQVANLDPPLVRLDTGGHTATIRGLAFTPDGKHIVSSGGDKVIRVWDWQTGKTIRTFRGDLQSSGGSWGQIFAMALSPNGSWLASGGSFAGDSYGAIRLYDFTSGALVALLKGHSTFVASLAFSPDSKRLVSGGFDFAAIIWDVETRALVHRLVGHKADIDTVGFTPDGVRVLTGSADTSLKLWGVKDGKEIATLSGHKGQVFRLAVSPSGKLFASGSADGEIRLWDGKTGRYMRSLTNDGWVGDLRFTRDGTRLLSTCAGSGCEFDQRLWDVATGKKLVTHADHQSSVLAAAMSPSGHLAATAGGINHEIHVWDLATGKTQRVLAGVGERIEAVGFSADGRQIAWGHTYTEADLARKSGALRFTMKLPAEGARLGWPERLDKDYDSTFLQGRVTHADYSLANRDGGSVLDLTKDGKIEVSIERPNFQHFSYSFSSDGQTIISGGGQGEIIPFNLQGGTRFAIDYFYGHEDAVAALATSPDGRLLVSGSYDQTVRLWNVATRELIVTLFHGTDGEWVMWTPQGYYTGSPGADRIVGWQINHGAMNAAEYVGAGQLRAHLNRPDIVEKAIILASAEQATRESPGTTFKIADLLKRPVPRFNVLSPTRDAVVRTGRTRVQIDIAEVPDPVKSVRVHVSGRQVLEMTPDIGSGGFKAGVLDLDVPLSKGRNDIRIILSNDVGENAETLTFTSEVDGVLDKRGTLYILAIGVDAYPVLGSTCGVQGDANCDLRYSGADARKFVESVENRLGPLHAKVVKRVLINGGAAGDAPTASNIIDATDLLKQARETDTVLLFIAGHGVNDGPHYRFLPTNAERVGSTFRNVTVVPWQFLQEAVESAKGRRILFLDTCHSGNAYNEKVGNAAYHANIITYASARFDQEALEDADLGHGLFTYAIVEGLSGKSRARREISTRELADYVAERVGELAKAMSGEQKPQYFKGRDVEDYVLARW